MIETNIKEQLDKLEYLSRSLIDFLNEIGIEYSKIIITKESVELVTTDKYSPMTDTAKN